MDFARAEVSRSWQSAGTQRIFRSISNLSKAFGTLAELLPFKSCVPSCPLFLHPSPIVPRSFVPCAVGILQRRGLKTFVSFLPSRSCYSISARLFPLLRASYPRNYTRIAVIFKLRTLPVQNCTYVPRIRSSARCSGDQSSIPNSHSISATLSQTVVIRTPRTGSIFRLDIAQVASIGLLQGSHGRNFVEIHGTTGRKIDRVRRRNELTKKN